MRSFPYKKIFGIGPLGALITLALLLLAWWVDGMLGHPRIHTGHPLVIALAVLLMACGLGLHVWTYQTLKRWWVQDELCTTGPFRFFRHPMYAAWITFVALGVSLVLNSWIFLAWYALLHPIWHRLVTREEAMMQETFGSEYLKLQDRTGRFFPRILNRRSRFEGEEKP